MEKIETKSEFGMPEKPPKVTLECEDSTRIDVCVLYCTNFNNQGVFVYIRTPDISMDKFLEKASELETGFFPDSPKELRKRVRGIIPHIPINDEERKENKYYILQYELSAKDKVYETIRGL